MTEIPGTTFCQLFIGNLTATSIYGYVRNMWYYDVHSTLTQEVGRRKRLLMSTTRLHIGQRDVTVNEMSTLMKCQR